MRFPTIEPKLGLESISLQKVGKVHWNVSPSALIEETIRRGQGTLADNGALCVKTGKFTGRSPKDKFVVKDDLTQDNVWWGSVNQAFSSEGFDRLFAKVQAYLQGNEVFVRDVYAGADERYRLKVRAINTAPWPNLFVNNMFIRPEANELEGFEPDWHVVAVPEFEADPEQDGTRQENFTLVNFSQKLILIGGSGYTGEIKKGIFTVMNYLLPMQGVLPMHCSANVGKEGDTSIFFGLSGTGKTTLSADPDRQLIGDDEHAWSDEGVFNFEGGCYAKVIDLSPEKEPQIWHAIKHGALVENTSFEGESRQIDFKDTSITQNTRVAYPIHHISGIAEPSIGNTPKNIFFLTCDAFGVLPPISKLTPGQAMFQFISGYTAKVAGTEEGITEPVTTFSACFGEPFLPLHPTRYAEMLGERIRKHEVNVWLVNTGWTGGSYGVGERMKLSYTRAMISAALAGKLDDVEYITDETFGLAVPQSVPNVPDQVLTPRATWADPKAFDQTAQKLARAFEKNFAQYRDFANEEILAAMPKVAIVS
ncbi:MAG: phosphoenolpyruvate carboxykinase (ATP) [Bacteroidota bacterium]